MWSDLLADIPHQQSSSFSFFLASHLLSASLTHLQLHLSHLFTKWPSARCSPPAPTPCHAQGLGARSHLLCKMLGLEHCCLWRSPLHLGVPCPGLQAHDYALHALMSMKSTGWAGPQCPNVSVRAMGQISRWICEPLAVSIHALQEVTLQVLQLQEELYQWQHGHIWLPFALNAHRVNGLNLNSYGSQVIIIFFS